MFDTPDKPLNELNDEEAFGLLQELQANASDELRRQRTSFRVSIKANVTLRPANARDKLTFKLKGITGDISEGGTSAMFPLPVQVGDVYRLEFDRNEVDLPMTFARCVRCRLVREDSFEAGFAFFTHIALPDNLATAADASLA